MEVDKLKITISADASEAIKAYKKLADAMEKLQTTASKDFNLDKLANQINHFAKATELAVKPLKELGDALDKIQRFNNGGINKIAKATNAVKKAAKGGGTTTSPSDGSVIKTPDAPKEATSWLERLRGALDGVEKSSEKAKSGYDKFTKSITKIAVYRIVRRLLTEIANAAKQGSENFYTFLNAYGSLQSKKITGQLDRISTSMNALGNTLGVTLLTLLASAAPLIETLAIGLIQILNVINALIASLQGSSTYFKANTEAIKKWSQTINYALQGFDELNVLSSNNGASPMDMFTEESTSEALKNLGWESAAVLGLATALGVLKGKTGNLTDAFKDKNTALSEQSELTGKETSLVDKLAGAVGGATTETGLLGKAIELLGGAVIIGSIVTLINHADDIANAFKNAKEAVGKLWDKITSPLSSITEAIEGFVSDINAAFKRITGATIPITVDLNIVPKVSTDGEVGGESGGGNVEVNAQPSTGTGSKFQTILDKVAQQSHEQMLQEKDGTSNSNGVSVPHIVSTIAAAGAGLTGLLASIGASAEETATTITSIASTAADKAASVFIMPIKQIEEALSFWKIGTGKGSGGSIQTRATGGFVNSAELFYANENGVPEMVGRIGNRTAVANNDQITEAIASAVYDAITSAQGNGNVNVVLEGDAKKLFTVVQKEARSYQRVTGNYAF